MPHHIVKSIVGPGEQLVSLILGHQGGSVFAKLTAPQPSLDSEAFCDDDFKGTAPGEKEINITIDGKLKRG